MGRLFGIEVGIHYSWFIIFALVTWSLAVGFFPVLYPGWPTGTYWVVGAISAILLFAAVLVHELSHSLVAKREGLPVSSITLFIFGGVSNITREPGSPGEEFWMALVGPLSSLIIGIVAGAAAFAVSGFNEQLTAVLFYLAIINLLLAFFNLVPAFPLDGGRVFRSIVWSITKDLTRATRIASIVGQGFAYLFIFGGILWAFSGNILSGLWFVLIGWFLNAAAEAAYRQVRTEELLKGVSVQQMMTRDVETVEPSISIRQLVDDYILPHNRRALPVVEDSELVGIITLYDVRNVPRSEWDFTLVRDVMTPRDRLYVLHPDDEVAQAFGILSQQDINQLPVLDKGKVIGFVTRGHLLRFLQTRQEIRGKP
jgi:Zn-dependent protease/CBS domain-containing protein